MTSSRTVPPVRLVCRIAPIRRLAAVVCSGLAGLGLVVATPALTGSAASAATFPETGAAAPVSLLTFQGAPMASPVTVPLSAAFIAANDGNSTGKNGGGDDGKKIKGDDGRRSFGVQPSGPTKPDPRPNLTYRDVKPGQRLFDHVAILNISAQPVTLSIFAADAFNTPAGAFDVLRAGQKSRDLGSWVKLRRDRVTIPARSAFITPVELRVPKNAEPGDHAAAILASLRSVSRDPKGNLINRDDRVGTRLYVRVVGRLSPRIELERGEADFSGDSPVKGRANVTYTIKNTGNVRLMGKQSIRVTSLLGLSTQAVDLPQLPELLPGGQFTFQQPVKDVIPTFLNTAHITIDPISITGNVDPALAQVSASSNFWALSWPGVLLLALLIGSGLRFWWRHRRRRPAAGPASWGGDGVAPPAGNGPVNGVRRGADAATRTGVVRRSASVRLALSAGIALAMSMLPLLAPVAQAAGGTLTFVPGQGTTGTPIYTVTSGPCPKEATNVIGYLFGKGMPAQGKVVIPNQDPPIRYDQAFGVGLQDNLTNFAKEEGVKELSGDYRLVLRCIDQFAIKTFAEFSGTITFPDPTRFTAPVPAKPPKDGVPVGYLALVFPDYQKIVEAEGKARTLELTGKTPAASAPAASKPAPAAAVAPAAEPVGSTLTPAGDNSGLTKSVLVVLLGLAGLAGLASLWSRKPHPATVSRGPAPVEWPQDEPTRKAKPGPTAGRPQKN